MSATADGNQHVLISRIVLAIHDPTVPKMGARAQIAKAKIEVSAFPTDFQSFPRLPSLHYLIANPTSLENCPQLHQIHLRHRALK